MNILFITMTYPTPARPRQGTFNAALVESLRKRHDVRVVAPIPWIQRFRPEFGSHELHPIYLYPPKVLRRHYGEFFWRSILPALKRLEKSFSPDLVVGYWLHPDGASAVRAADRFQTPCVVISGGSDLRLLSKERARRRKIERVLSNVDRLVVVSRDLRSCAIELGMPPSQVDVVYRGVDRRVFSACDQDDARRACGLPADSIVIFWAGRLEAVKNPQMLIQAAKRWKTHWGERLHVLVAGDGGMRSELFRMRNRLGLSDCVRFEGNLRQSELALRFIAADVTCLTSRSEGIPNVLLESLACGTPFVATDVGGVGEIATAGVDRLVASGDVDGFASAVIEQMETTSRGVRSFVPDGLHETAIQFESAFDRAMRPSPNAPLSMSRSGFQTRSESKIHRAAS